LSLEVDDLMAGVLRPIVPNIERLLGRKIPNPPILDADAAQQRFYSTILRVFREQEKPVVLLLEDLQWTSESLNVLKQLNRILEEAPILIIATYRNDEKPHLPDELKEMQVFELERFDREEIVTISKSVLGSAAVRPGILDLLQDETEGNAYFLIEVLRTLAEEAGQLSKISSMVLPERVFPKGIMSIVKRRLSQVPQSAHQMLSIAAVAGREIDPKILNALDPTLNFEEWVFACSEAGVLEASEFFWRFAHNKLRDGLVGGLSEKDRRSYHQQIAEAIEKVYPDETAQAITLLGHWEAAGTITKAREYAYLSGVHLAAQYAHVEAVEYLTKALDFVQATDTDEFFKILSKREEVYDWLGSRDEQKADLDRLTAFASKSKDTTIALKVTLLKARYGNTVADYDFAFQEAQLAVEQAREMGDLESEAKALGEWSMALTWQGKHDEARGYAKIGLEICRQIQDTEGEARMLNSLAIAYYYQGDYEQARKYYLLGLEINEKADDQRGVAQSINNLAIIASSQGSFKEARKYYEEGLKVCRSIGFRWNESKVLNNLGHMAEQLGDFSNATRYFDDALLVNREIGSPQGEGVALINLGIVKRNQGLFEQAEFDLQRSRKILENINAQLLVSYSIDNLGRLAFQQDDYDKAQAYFQEALEIRKELNLPYLVIESQAGLAQAGLAKGEDVQAVLNVLLEYINENPNLEGTESPARIYLVCFEILQSIADPRAKDLLRSAYEFLMDQVEKIDIQDLRQTYLENINEHAEVVRHYELVFGPIEAEEKATHIQPGTIIISLAPS
jgi:tetratricopeptide (TPR) repeat protein